MDFKPVPVQTVHLLHPNGFLKDYEINCLATYHESFRDKLFVGTQKGLLVLRVVTEEDGKVKMAISETHQGLGNIVQMDVLQQKKCVVSLSKSGILQVTRLPNFITSSAISIPGAYKYAMSGYLDLCVVTRDALTVYKWADYNFKKVELLHTPSHQLNLVKSNTVAINDTVRSLVFRDEAIFVGYDTCYTIRNSQTLAYIITIPTHGIPIAVNYGFSVLLQDYYKKSVCYQANGTLAMNVADIEWENVPSVIACKFPTMFGLTARSLEIRSTVANSGEKAISFPIEGLKCITSSGDVYVATQNQIWRVLVSTPKSIFSGMNYNSNNNTKSDHKRQCDDNRRGVGFAEEEGPEYVYEPPADGVALGKIYKKSKLDDSREEMDFMEYYNMLDDTAPAVPPVLKRLDPSTFATNKPRTYQKYFNFASTESNDKPSTKRNEKPSTPLDESEVASLIAVVDAADAVDATARDEARNALHRAKMLENLEPEDPVDSLGMNKEYVDTLNSHHIFTIRQFALPQTLDLFPNTHGILGDYEKACKIVEKKQTAKRHAAAPAASYEHRFAYLCLPFDEITHIIDAQAIKSPYVLFQEYVDSPIDDRHKHPWKHVCKQFNDRRSKTYEYLTLSDLDVFSHIEYELALSVGKLNVTGGSRAIHFHWQRQKCSNNHMCVSIDMIRLCETYKAQMFRKTGSEYVPMSLDKFVGIQAQSANDPIVPTCSSDFDALVVTPDGTIPKDYFEIIEPK